MKNEITVLGKSVELIQTEDEKVIFDAYAVAEALGYRDASAKISRDIDDEYKIKVGNKNFITEAGIYQLAFSSKLPEAKKFTNWVIDTLLPTIRKNGFYVLGLEFASEERIKKIASVIEKHYGKFSDNVWNSCVIGPDGFITSFGDIYERKFND